MSDETQEQDQETTEGGESMEALLKEHTDFHEKLAKREVVWVKVVLVTGDQVLVDVGERNEAVIPLSEFPEDEKPVAGRRVPAVLVRIPDEPHGIRGAHPSHRIAKMEHILGWIAKYTAP
mgnify:CR=1 FL=1